MNSPIEFLVPCIFLTIVFLSILGYRTQRRRRAFIQSYAWPPGLLEKLARHQPHLSDAERLRVGEGLKQFFQTYLESGFMPVAMPSQVADDLWHEFILYTRAYQAFTKRAFGRFLHHTPAAVLRPDQKADNAGLRRVWWQACRLEGVDPKSPARLPLLFALDRDLKIPNGFHYQPDCAALRSSTGAAAYCGGDFISISFDGTTIGFGADGGGDGDGDGGGGCGGD